MPVLLREEERNDQGVVLSLSPSYLTTYLSYIRYGKRYEMPKDATAQKGDGRLYQMPLVWYHCAKIEGRAGYVLMTTKEDQLKQLRDRIEQDMSLPLRAEATQLVFGEGNPDAKIYFLGEAPGQSEDKQGRPFVGRAGKLLNTLLEHIGMQRADVYISNIVRFRPPNNRPPTSAEIAAFLPYVNEEIAIIQPLLIVTLGRFSLAKFLPTDKITQVHGTLHTVNWQGRPIHVFPLYHPAAALRSPEMRSTLEEDFNKIPSVLERLQS